MPYPVALSAGMARREVPPATGGVGLTGARCVADAPQLMMRAISRRRGGATQGYRRRFSTEFFDPPCDASTPPPQTGAAPPHRGSHSPTRRSAT